MEESELPGLGWKYSLRDAETGDRVVVVVHHSGKRELYHFQGEEDAPRDVLSLTDEESRKVGAILMGAYFHPQPGDARLDLPGARLAWIGVTVDSPLAGAELGEMPLLLDGDARAIALLRGGEVAAPPNPQTRLRAGDVVLLLTPRRLAPPEIVPVPSL